MFEAEIGEKCKSCHGLLKHMFPPDGEATEEFLQSKQNWDFFNDKMEMEIIEYKSTPNQQVIDKPRKMIIKDTYPDPEGEFVWSDGCHTYKSKRDIWTAITAVAFAAFVLFIIGLIAYGLFLKA